jgi:hypothetical protein
MSAVMIRCPNTGPPVSTQIETEPSIFVCLPTVNSEMSCPICGADHVWSLRDAWLAERGAAGSGAH